MKGWLFTGTDQPFQLGDIEPPVAGPGEAVLEVKAAGLCHSDVGTMHDPKWLALMNFLPIVMGHEVAGVVTSVGEGVTNVRVGDRVGVCPTNVGGAPGYRRHGGFTFQHVAPAVDLVHMPDGLSFEHAALGTDAGMTSYHAMVTQGAVQAGMKVGVIGLGGLGQIGARVAVVRGAEVHVAERNEAAWPMATEIGCVSVVRDASEWAGAGFDLVVDYAGFDVTTRAAAKAVRRNGRVVLVGMGALEFTLDTMDIIRSQVQLFGSNGGTLSDVAEVYEMLAAGEVNPVVNVIGFDDIPAALDDLRHHRLTGRIVARY
jgi:propanol-preferring alcohol dehydrogenase